MDDPDFEEPRAARGIAAQEIKQINLNLGAEPRNSGSLGWLRARAVLLLGTQITWMTQILEPFLALLFQGFAPGFFYLDYCMISCAAIKTPQEPPAAAISFISFG